MKIKGTDIIITRGDITRINVEAVVNAANTNFEMGGGLALAIKKRGGVSIENEAMGKGPKVVGEAVLTKAGDLRAKYVIHAVTMGMDFITSESAIREATYNALLCAHKNNISSVAFCALGCGTGKFSPSGSAKIMAQEVFRYIHQVSVRSIKKIIFVAYSSKVYDAFSNNVERYLKYMIKKISEGPFLTVDGVISYNEGIIMVKRSNPPFGWALPGGFVDYGESAEDAVAREIKEETNLDFVDIKQFHTYSRPGRDPRFHTVSVVFTGKGTGILKSGDDAASASIFNKNNLPPDIAFDHREIIQEYFNSLKI